MLGTKSLGNSGVNFYTKFVILDIKLFYLKQLGHVLEHWKVP